MFKRISLAIILIISIYIMMSCSQEDPVDKAARLVKESYALGKDQPVELTIENALTKIKNREEGGRPLVFQFLNYNNYDTL